MFNWLTSRIQNSSSAPSHPLGTDNGIAAYLAELPPGDPQRTLIELTNWFGDPPGFIDQMPPERAMRAVEKLDEYARDAVRRYWENLLAEAQTHRSGQFAGTVLKNFLAGSHACNRRIFELLAATPAHRDDKRLLARFATRALHNLAEGKKLGRMAYQAADAAWWENAHHLLRQSRDLGLTHLAQAAYPGHALVSSVWKEYQAALLIEMAPLTSLTTNEIEAADRLARWIEPHCKFADARNSLTPFCIRPDGGNMPARWQENGNYPDGTRFFGVGQGLNQLIQLRISLTRDKKLPDWLASTGCNHEQMLQLLPNLIANWSSTPPTRQCQRLQSKGTLRVVNGLDMVRRMLAASEFARSGRSLDYDTYLRDFHARHRDHELTPQAPPPPPKTPMEVLRLLETAGDQQMMELWDIIDISEGGLGARFAGRRLWQRIGALVAYRQDHELDWHVGIIRRLGSSQGKPNAGLSTFPETALCSQIRLAASLETNAWSQRTQETSGLGWHNAIVVSSEKKLVLIPAGIFAEDRAAHLSIEGRWRPVRLLTLQGRGNDYDLATYQEEAAAP